MANITREKRENTFFKLVNTIGLCFTSCKLVQNSLFFYFLFFLGRRILFKMSKPPHTIYKFKIWLCLVQLVLTMNRERKKGFDTMGSLNFQFFSFNLVSHDTSVLLDFYFYFLSYLILYFYFVFLFFGGERHKSGTKLHI